MGDAYIIGAFVGPFGRHDRASLRDLASPVVMSALSASDLGPSDVGAVFFANAVAGALWQQENIRGQVALRGLGLEQASLINVEDACATGSVALHLALQSVTAGAVDVALVVGAEKLYHPDRHKRLQVFDFSLDANDREQLSAELGIGKRRKASTFLHLYAHKWVSRWGMTGDWIHDAAVIAVKNHANARDNPSAHRPALLSVSDVLQSPVVVAPLTLQMCSSISDGAAAIVVSSRRRGKSARVLASAVAAGRGDRLDIPRAARRAATMAWANSGVAPADLDVVEVHDATAPGELMAYEDLGLCNEGGAGQLLRSGATALSGRTPVNPSGGLLGRGHPIGVTGIAQAAELYWQVTESAGNRQVAGARVGAALNLGGFLGNDEAVAAVHVLERA